MLFLFRRRRFDCELAEEMQYHLDLKAQAGGGTEEARYRARREFGNSLLLRERSRDLWGWRWLRELAQDLRFALRMLLRGPGFTAIAVLSLALGIGANTAIFSLVNMVLLRPLPYREPGRLVALWEWNIRDRHINTVTGGNYADWKARNHVFEELGYSWDTAYTFTGTNNPESTFGYMLSCNFFRLLGAAPLVGRTFAAEECQTGKDHVVVLSYKLWQRRFAGDRDITGRAVQLDGVPYTVIGVMPAAFTHPSIATALWTPLALPADALSDRKNHALRVIGRLEAGVTFERAQIEMGRLATQLAKEYPDTDTGMGVQLWPIRDLYVGDVKPALVALQMAVLLMLLIACANVANLLVARACAREREVALRRALGAGRLRLIRQLLTEGVLLGMLGGAAGVVLALWSVSALASLLPASFAGLVDMEHARAWINTPVLLLAVLLSMASGIVFGAAPAFRGSASPSETLKAVGRSLTEGRGRMRLRGALVVSQIALSLVLLIGAGLIVRSFLRLADRRFGFRTDHVLTLELILRENRFADAERMAPFLEQVSQKIEAISGVESVGIISTLPLTGHYARRNFTIPGQPELPYAQQNVAEFRVVTPAYFRTMGIALGRGRYFDANDRAGAPGVAIINETLARRMFLNQDPIGRTIRVADAGMPEAREIVGIVGDTRHHELAIDPEPEIYRPFYQVFWPFFGIAVRSSGDPLAVASAVRSAIWSVDKEQPINSMATIEQLAGTALATRRASMILLSLFAGIALVLSAIGIYGIMAYSVTHRTHEIGIRMALGAEARSVLGMVLGRAVLLAAGGVAIGLAGAAGATRLLRSQLVDISATDPITFAVISVSLSAVALLAAYLPARRASKVDPVVALRYE
jgi:predicted permease